MSMRSLILVLALCAGAASAGTWRYELTPGKTYRYAFKSDSRSQVAAPMMGGGVPESRTQIETHYSVKVDRALADGRYDVGLTIEKLVIDDAATGRKVTLTDLPGVARTARALMSRRGKFQFYERPVLQVSANGHYALGVVSASASAVSSEARASNGEEEVRLVTSIDMKTGKMSASVEKSRPQRAKSQEEAPPRKLEVFPVELLALMELPEGPVTPGKTEAMGTGSALQATGVAKAPAACGQAKCGVLELTVASKVDTGGPGRAAAAEQADRTQEGGGEAEMSAPGGMPDGMPGIPGGMPGMPDGMPGMPGGMQPSMAGGAGESETKMSLRATLRFDESAGNLFDVSGSSSSDTSMMGAKITDHSTFTLRSVP